MQKQSTPSLADSICDLRSRKIKKTFFTQINSLLDKLVGKTRFKVECTFGGIKRWFSGGVAKYRGIDKMHTQNLIEAVCYNLYRSPRIIATNYKK